MLKVFLHLVCEADVRELGDMANGRCLKMTFVNDMVKCVCVV